MIYKISGIMFLLLCTGYYSSPVTASVTVGVNSLSIVHKSSNGVTITFPDVCKTPSPAGSVPIPYPIRKVEGEQNKKQVKKGDNITFTLHGDNLENILSAEVCLVCEKNNNFKTVLETLPKGQKNVSKRKVTITYLGNEKKHVQINIRKDMISAPLFSREFNAPENEPVPYPVSGNTVYHIKSKADISSPYQLIQIETKEDLVKTKTYLNEIIKTARSRGLNTAEQKDYFADFYYNSSKTAYLFISSAHDECVYKKPYLKDGNIWFDGVAKNRTEAPHFSAWLFYVPQGMEFRVRIKTAEFDMETGRATLLSNRFKRGIKKAERAGDFEILFSGEYFDENKLIRSEKGTKKKSVFGIKSYQNSITVERGSLIGFTYVYRGSGSRKHTFKIIPPDVPPAVKKDLRETEMEILCENKKTDNFIWQFSEEHEMIPGVWTLQITDKNRIIYEKKFTVKTTAHLGNKAVRDVKKKGKVAGKVVDD